MWELNAKLKQLPAWQLATSLGELEAGGPPKSLAPSVGSKSQKEDRGDIDEDGGHLYDRIKMMYEEGYDPEPVLTQGTEDAISLVSNLSPPCLKHEFSYPPTVLSIANVTSPSFENKKDLLIQNEKLMWAHEEKVQILVAICASLPAIAEKATPLWAAGVPDPDAAIITGAWPLSSSEESGTSTGGNSPGSQDLHGGSGTTTLPDHPEPSTPPCSASQLPHSW